MPGTVLSALPMLNSTGPRRTTIFIPALHRGKLSTEQSIKLLSSRSFRVGEFGFGPRHLCAVNPTLSCVLAPSFHVRGGEFREKFLAFQKIKEREANSLSSGIWELGGKKEKLKMRKKKKMH